MTEDSSLPQIEICPDADATSLRVAEIIAAAIRSNPQIVLGLATGGTPVGTYRELVRMHREQGLDFSGIRSFNLDEYLGLGPEHPQSFRYFMQQHLFDHVNVDPSQTHVPDGLAVDVDAHTRDYEQQIRAAGGIDLQLLGIGSNGHIAFNEPGSPADSRTRAIDLTADTITANSRFFDSIDQVPRHAITMGIGTILESKQIVLMANGEGKADTVARAIQSDADPSHPASLLQKHGDVMVVLDAAAAKRLIA
jgi:glucosamine-6-phosphate deaminase